MLAQQNVPELLSVFCNHTATTEIYTLSLHDALPISPSPGCAGWARRGRPPLDASAGCAAMGGRDRKSTRLNSSHVEISYAVFCLKKKRCLCIHAISIRT